MQRAILAPQNTEVQDINSAILQIFKGEERAYHSIDRVQDDHDGTHEVEDNYYPTEFLNSINIGGLPPSKLELKPGVPLMLLRNLDPANGLCNGTRMRLLNSTYRVLQVKILTGTEAGRAAFIPRITLESNKGELEFLLKCRQFPVRLAFAMTINKSQGQSLGTVGLCLTIPVFSHGQFYVGVSRGTNWNRVKILLSEEAHGKTSNVVYPEVILKS